MNKLVDRIEREIAKPTIRVVAGELAEITRQAERAILQSGFQIYQRGPFLVRPVVQEVDAAHGRKTTTAQLVPVESPYLRLILAEAAKWERYSTRARIFLLIP